MEGYRHIELTDEEVADAIISAKRKKDDAIKHQRLLDIQEENRKLRQMEWDFEIIRTFMYNRAKKVFGTDHLGEPRFILDKNNIEIFDLLCFYFIGNEEKFVEYATEMGVANPSINKGLLLPGNVGTGKTWMMKLLSRNNRQSFEMVAAKDIANEFLAAKDKLIPDVYMRPFRNNVDVGGLNIPGEEVFGQQVIGLCIDDMGSESMKNNFGNKINVIGDIIETRYSYGYTGVFLHGTTNLNADEIAEFYGERVASRAREIFNFIELPGIDRRK